MQKRNIFIVIGLIIILSFLASKTMRPGNNEMTSIRESKTMVFGAFDKTMTKSDEEWKKILTPEQYHILREAGTEIPFTGKLNQEKRKGTYYSVGCGKPLFRSEQKYDSGTGWPSFWAPISENALVLRKESAPGDDRIEVLDKCGGHLGHVFDDGPIDPSAGSGHSAGKRYCMNSIALRFVPDEN